jgi:hypothetical protein
MLFWLATAAVASSLSELHCARAEMLTTAGVPPQTLALLDRIRRDAPLTLRFEGDTLVGAAYGLPDGSDVEDGYLTPLERPEAPEAACTWFIEGRTYALLAPEHFVVHGPASLERPPPGIPAWRGRTHLDAARQPRAVVPIAPPTTVALPTSVYLLNGGTPPKIPKHPTLDRQGRPPVWVVGELHANRSDAFLQVFPTDDPEGLGDAVQRSWPEHRVVRTETSVLLGSDHWLDEIAEGNGPPWWSEPIRTPGLVALWGLDLAFRAVTTETGGMRRTEVTGLSTSDIFGLERLEGPTSLETAPRPTAHGVIGGVGGVAPDDRPFLRGTDVTWLKRPAARYPRAARGLGLGSFTCNVRASFDADGRAVHVHVSACPKVFSDVLKDAAQWRARPVAEADQGVPFDAVTKVRFDP